MTTTIAFQSLPDSYDSPEKCEAANRLRQQTNPRYKNFIQTHFTAGDEEQFQAYRDASNKNVCIPEIDISKNLFVDIPFNSWQKYDNINADAVINTFRYIFNKFKKGIFVKIEDNNLVVFLPFSKSNFINEWAHLIHIDPRYKDLDDFLEKNTGKGYTYKRWTVNKKINEWYANNCILRYDINPRTKKPNEGDTNVGAVKNMLEELCANRKLPDIEFFMNRRDFPILTRDGTEPYNNIWGANTRLVSHDFPKYLPILSMCKTERYADITIPTHEDWARVQSQNGIWFPKSCRDYTDIFNVPWANKKNIAVFRGASTGCGVTVETNQRLKLAHIASRNRHLIDGGISKWNLRPRKMENLKYLQVMDTSDLGKKGVELVDFLSMKDQSAYKYVINVDGHVSAFRLSLELSIGSVILLVKSEWKIWYSDMLIPYKHYVPVKRDLSDLISQIKWCQENDDKCQEITVNAKAFFDKYLQKDGIFDFLQKTIIDMKNTVGVYLYNYKTPLDIQIENEKASLVLDNPETTKTSSDINSIPDFSQRNFGLLQGVHWVFNLCLKENNFSSVMHRGDKLLFSNKLSRIDMYFMGNRRAGPQFPFSVKSTLDVAKKRENIHDAFVGIKAVNHLLKHIPNFAYTFGLFDNEKNETVVVREFIGGYSLLEYLSSREFSFNEFLCIMIQICLAIQIAQDKIGFVHYDLTPWNIILQPSKNAVFDYVLRDTSIIRIKTNLVPVIIDYGKSHVIVNQKHHGFVNMFKVSTIQDMLSLMLISVRVIIENQRLSKIDFKSLLQLANFISGTRYRRDKFTTALSVKEFLQSATKYSTLITSDKYELEKLGPYDMFTWIMDIGKTARYNFTRNVRTVNQVDRKMIMGNSRQIFEFILSSSIEEKAQTYFNVFMRLKHCTIPQPDNIFFVYYAAQELSRNIASVGEQMEIFLDITSRARPETESSDGSPMARDTYRKAYKNCMDFLNSVYNPKIYRAEFQPVTYNIEGDFSSLQKANYTEESFLDPSFIKNILDEGEGKVSEDLSKYHEIITSVFLDDGPYKLDKAVKADYQKNFKKLLSIDPLIMKNNTANLNTLQELSQKIYPHDLKILMEELPGVGDCSDAGKYLKLYSSIVNTLHSNLGENNIFFLS